jgi:4-hydroxyphenylpyruvate dioxygenase
VRTDLSAEDVERLRANNILYDRDDDGEYFQVYTKTMEGGFFFEIVERRRYQGYGAVNAPIRLASQTHLASGGTPSEL